MITHLVIGLLGAGIFLRIVGKEKHRRYRHLLLRLAEQEKRLAELEAAQKPQVRSSDADTKDDPGDAAVFEAQPIGQAA